MEKLPQSWRAWDLQVSKLVFSVAEYLNWEVEPISSATAHLPGVRSPTILITSLLLYLVVVASGCKLLSSKADRGVRDAWWLRAIVISHNLFLISLSLYMCFGCLSQAYQNGYTLWGNEYKEDEKQLAFYIYLFYISKIYEFFDTFIMLLKNNLRQISFLHVYHHSTISLIWWMIARRAPGGDAYFSAALNSWVHVCMYTYYLLAIILGKSPEVRSKYLWWGRHLTQMQILQFVLNLFQALYCVSYSKYPKFLSNILLVYMMSLLVLFGHFYYLKHIASSKMRQKQS